MKKVLAFGASNSKQSINQQLAIWAAHQIENIEVKVIDLNDYEMPIFSIDKEQQDGIPQLAHDFKAIIGAVDGIIISFAEHNGSFSSAYKNITDWVSRIEKSMWLDKIVFLMSTSPGQRGGASVLDHANTILPHSRAQVVGSFSLPLFSENFSNGISNPEAVAKFNEAFKPFKNAMV